MPPRSNTLYSYIYVIRKWCFSCKYGLIVNYRFFLILHNIVIFKPIYKLYDNIIYIKNVCVLLSLELSMAPDDVSIIICYIIILNTNSHKLKWPGWLPGYNIKFIVD